MPREREREREVTHSLARHAPVIGMQLPIPKRSLSHLPSAKPSHSVGFLALVTYFKLQGTVRMLPCYLHIGKRKLIKFDFVLRALFLHRKADEFRRKQLRQF